MLLKPALRAALFYRAMPIGYTTCRREMLAIHEFSPEALIVKRLTPLLSSAVLLAASIATTAYMVASGRTKLTNALIVMKSIMLIIKMSRSESK